MLYAWMPKGTCLCHPVTAAIITLLMLQQEINTLWEVASNFLPVS